MQKKLPETEYVDVSKINLGKVPTADLKAVFDLQVAIEDLLISNVQLEASASSKLYSTIVVFLVVMLALVFHARPQTVFALASITQLLLILIDRIAIYGLGKLKHEANAKYAAEITRLEKKYPIQ